jgi:hypothetical protein
MLFIIPSKIKYNFMLSNIYKLKSILFILFLTISCDSLKEHTQIHKGFYYWKTDFLWKQEDNDLIIKQLKSQKLYIRFFDVVWQNNTVQPAGTLSFTDSLPKNELTLIPVIFITQDVVREIPENQIDSLANKIVIKIYNMLQRQKINHIEELQIDCDWTEKSQKTYFKLLQSIKKYKTVNHSNNIVALFKNSKISSTIRLYPMKYYKKLGIPPVDKGILMCYNLENPTILTNNNSILSYKTAVAYLSALPDYPLELDIALPIFAWSVQFRNGKFLRLLHEVRHKNLLQNTDFQALEPNIFRAIQTTTLNQQDILAGDILRVDETKKEEIEKVYQLINEKINNNSGNRNVTFFDYSKESVKNLPSLK